MKCSLFMACLLFAISESKGQQVKQEVLSSGGSYDVNELYALEWTLGETVASTFLGSQRILTQGFNQPMILSFGSPRNVTNRDIQVRTTPNPTVNAIQVLVDKPASGRYYIVISDVKGNTLRSRNDAIAGTPALFSVSDFASGVYLVHVYDNAQLLIHTTRFVKL